MIIDVLNYKLDNVHVVAKTVSTKWLNELYQSYYFVVSMSTIKQKNHIKICIWNDVCIFVVSLLGNSWHVQDFPTTSVTNLLFLIFVIPGTLIPTELISWLTARQWFCCIFLCSGCFLVHQLNCSYFVVLLHMLSFVFLCEWCDLPSNLFFFYFFIRFCSSTTLSVSY